MKEVSFNELALAIRWITELVYWFGRAKMAGMVKGMEQNPPPPC